MSQLVSQSCLSLRFSIQTLILFHQIDSLIDSLNWLNNCLIDSLID